MLKVQKVLIPTDFSESGKPSLVRGFDLAEQFKAEVHLLHVALLADAAPVYPVFNLPSDTERIYQQLHDACQAKLDALLPEAPAGTVKRVLRHASSAAPILLKYAEEEDVDLIAMGTHGRRGVRRFLLGSVAEEVVRKANCPVVTFRPQADTEIRRPRRILAAVDFSDHSRRVVTYARELGSLYHATIDLVHVIPEPNFPVFYEFASGTEIYANLAETRKKARTALEDLVRETPGPEAPFAAHVCQGQPAEELLRFGEEHDTDMIILATHGLTGLSHLLLGSVAEKVLRQAECPVLTVRAFGKTLIEQNVA